MGKDIAIIGLGEIGLPTAKYCKSQGHTVWGVDINGDRVKEAKKHSILATVNWKDIYKMVDAYIVCVSTKSTDGLPDVEAVIKVCKKIKNRWKKEKAKSDTPLFISIESTIPPFTTQQIWETIFVCDPDVWLVHVPQRFWKDDPRERGVHRLRLLGAVTDEAMAQAAAFYSHELNMPFIEVPLEVAEMAKVSENAYRYTQIAYTQELKILCDELGIDYDDVCRAIRTIGYSHYLPEARDGIGGHCLPMAAEWIEFLNKSVKRNDPLIKAARFSDENYRRWLKKE